MQTRLLQKTEAGILEISANEQVLYVSIWYLTSAHRFSPC